MVLEILICTYNAGIEKIPGIILEQRDNVKWLVSHQYSDQLYKKVPSQFPAGRTDIKYVSHEGMGLSKNRNVALSHATGDILLIADDDAKFKNAYFDTIINTFLQNPDTDIACFQAITHEGHFLHKYPAVSFAYPNMPKGYWFNSQEIAIRNNSQMPHFDVRFGINAPKLGSGEEEVFLWQAYKNGLTIKYFPDVIVETDATTTRHAFYQNASLQRAKGGVLCIIHGVGGAFLRCLKFSILNYRKTNPFVLLWNMVYGIIYVKL